jgi:hypothetical protein
MGVKKQITATQVLALYVKSEVKLSAPMVRLAKMEHTPKPECVK